MREVAPCIKKLEHNVPPFDPTGRLNDDDLRCMQRKEIPTWHLYKDETLKHLRSLMQDYALSLVGIRGTCSVGEKVVTDTFTILTPAQIIDNGLERADVNTFRVTKFKERDPDIDFKSLEWAHASAGSMLMRVREKGIEAQPTPTLIIYHPARIYTTDRLSPMSVPTTTFLKDIPDDYKRAEMKIQGSPAGAILSVVVLS